MRVIITRLIISAVTLSVVGCGKPANQKKKKDDSLEPGKRRSPLQNRVEFLKKQDVQCPNERDCPFGLAKVVSIYEEKYQTCTGVLVTSQKLLIPTNCIPEALRYYNVSCSNNLYFFFPNQKKQGVPQKASKFLCDKVLKSDYYDSKKDPSLIKNGLSLVSLIKKVEPWRKPIKMEKRVSFKDGTEDYDIYSFKQSDDYRGIIQKGKCKIFFNTYANPFGSHSQSPVHMASDCTKDYSSSGGLLFAPLKSNLMGVMRREFDYKKFENFLKKELAPNTNLSKLYYVQSMGCLPYNFIDSSIKNRQRGNESKYCDEVWTEKMLLQKRIRLKYQKGIHRNNINSAEFSIRSIENYFKWDVHFKVKNSFDLKITDGDLEEESEDTDEPRIISHTYPDCFFKKESWIGRLKEGIIKNYQIPIYEFMVKYDNFLRPISFVKNTTQNVKIKFSLRKVRKGYRKVKVNLRPSPYEGKSEWVIETRCFNF